jgi:hypothetical protein
MPKNNIVPSSIKDGGTDALDRKVDKLNSEGVPK